MAGVARMTSELPATSARNAGDIGSIVKGGLARDYDE
jgi:hypothetical protein